MLGIVVALVSLDLPSVVPPAWWSPPGWSQFVDLIKWALDSLANTFNNAGLAVIVFTILIKTALMPLTVQSLRSSKAMQELQPKIKELQKKYGKDRQRLTQEQMRLYSEHRVNPMAGCLPLILQIPIFLGLYQAISSLSGSGEGYWTGGFLWLDSLDEADPYRVLPFLAGGFQFVQTKMMRPYKQGKITDPQQAMMNTMMNFMPLTVIIFGWGFASGPVLYWATQSVYSVVQQWFITGWGSMRDWFEWLPELPEHRRLGYRAPRPLDEVVVVSGTDDGTPPRAPGFAGWIQDRLQESQKRAVARREAAIGARGDVQSRADAESEAIAEASNGGGRPVPARSRGNARRGAGGTGRGARANAGNGATARNAAAANGQASELADTQAPAASRAVIVPRKSRPAPKADG